MRVFVYRTVKLFLDTEGVSDYKRSGWPWVFRTLQVINAVRSRINQNPVWKKKKIMAQEMDIASRTMNHITKQNFGIGAFKRQTGQCLTVALKENRKKIKNCYHCMVKSIVKKSSLQVKKMLLRRKLSIRKTIEFMHGHPRKPANWCQGSNEFIILFGGECLMTASLLHILWKGR